MGANHHDPQVDRRLEAKRRHKANSFVLFYDERIFSTIVRNSLVCQSSSTGTGSHGNGEMAADSILESSYICHSSSVGLRCFALLSKANNDLRPEDVAPTTQGRAVLVLPLIFRLTSLRSRMARMSTSSTSISFKEFLSHGLGFLT